MKTYDGEDEISKTSGCHEGQDGDPAELLGAEPSPEEAAPGEDPPSTARISSTRQRAWVDLAEDADYSSALDLAGGETGGNNKI